MQRSDKSRATCRQARLTQARAGKGMRKSAAESNIMHQNQMQLPETASTDRCDSICYVIGLCHAFAGMI
jgi:hypothetical protein